VQASSAAAVHVPKERRISMIAFSIENARRLNIATHNVNPIHVTWASYGDHRRPPGASMNLVHGLPHSRHRRRSSRDRIQGVDRMAIDPSRRPFRSVTRWRDNSAGPAVANQDRRLDAVCSHKATSSGRCPRPRPLVLISLPDASDAMINDSLDRLPLLAAKRLQRPGARPTPPAFGIPRIPSSGG